MFYLSIGLRINRNNNLYLAVTIDTKLVLFLLTKNAACCLFELNEYAIRH